MTANSSATNATFSNFLVGRRDSLTGFGGIGASLMEFYEIAGR